MKGVLFTAGLLLVCIAVLSLSLILQQQSLSETAAASRLMVFGRMNDEVSSISNGFRDIIGAAVNATVNGNVASFSEALPNTQAALFSDGVDKWKQFSESNSMFAIELNVTDAKAYLPLTLQPDGATYTHPDGFGGDTIKVAGAANATAYALDITLSRSKNAQIKWDTLSAGSDIAFSVRVHAKDESSDTQQLNGLQQSLLKIRQGPNTITVQIGSPSDKGMLQVSNPDGISAIIATNVTLAASGMLSVTLPEQSINIKENQYNISKASAIRIA